MEEYRLALALEVENPYEQLLALHRLCFGQYEGVLPFDEEVLRWFVQRPGLGLKNTLIMLHGRDGVIVSSLFLTLGVFYFAGNLVPVGIIDTVMTHPAHRGRGLATTLLREAENIMRARGCWFGYLYTIPNTGQFRLYQKLGYRDFKRVFHLQSAHIWKRDCLFGGRESLSLVSEEVQRFLNETLRAYNGFVPFDEQLWRWRKVCRPKNIPVTVIVSRNSVGIQATLTLTFGQIVTPSGNEEVVFLSDWAASSKEEKEKVLQEALFHLGDVKVDILCPVDNLEEWQILQEYGFSPYLAESTMLLPLCSEAEQLLLEASSRPWYPLIESIVGV